VGTLLWGALALVTASLSVVCAGHALLWKRDSRAALGWIGAGSPAREPSVPRRRLRCPQAPGRSISQPCATSSIRSPTAC
jgi:hypothetical protein